MKLKYKGLVKVSLRILFKGEDRLIDLPRIPYWCKTVPAVGHRIRLCLEELNQVERQLLMDPKYIPPRHGEGRHETLIVSEVTLEKNKIVVIADTDN